MTSTESGTARAPMGRRERKKAATRQAITDAALCLFLERGYDDVSIREIADTADAAVTTLFKYFPVKEALVFDEDADQEGRLLAAVRERPADQFPRPCASTPCATAWPPRTATPASPPSST
jgi:AcrR family transcriptional regulator